MKGWDFSKGICKFIHNFNAMTDKKSNLYLLLSAFFVGNAFLAELTGAKIFSAGELLFRSVWYRFRPVAAVVA